MNAAWNPALTINTPDKAGNREWVSFSTKVKAPTSRPTFDLLASLANIVSYAGINPATEAKEQDKKNIFSIFIRLLNWIISLFR